MENTEEESFLRTIRGEPHDDAPRLVFADWLEEHGQPERAEYIRLQCALANLPPEDPQRPALTKREKQLWQKHAGRWRSPLPSRIRRYQFQRGFIFPQSVELTAKQFLDLPDECFAAAPLWGVRLYLGTSDGVKELVNSPR